MINQKRIKKERIKEVLKATKDGLYSDVISEKTGIDFEEVYDLTEELVEEGKIVEC